MTSKFENITKRIDEAENNIKYVKDVLEIIKSNDDLEIVKEGRSNSSWSFEDDMEIILRSKKADKLLGSQDRFKHWYSIKITQRQKILFEFFIHQNDDYEIQHKNISARTFDGIIPLFKKVDKYLDRTTLKQLSNLKKFNK